MAVRTSFPSTDNKYYITTTGGGYNKCIPGNAANKYKARPTKYFVLPNCVGYVYGRYLEYWGLKGADLPTCNAKNWYSEAKKRGFKCSKTPSVGSIIVFNGSTYGHVAFVERIEANGDLYLSESNWSHQAFRNWTCKKSNGYNMSNSYPLLGFIANPNPPKATTTTTKKIATTTKPVVKNVTYTITASALNIRKGAGTKYASIGTYKAGEKVVITKISGDWGQTNKGWISMKYTRICQTYTTGKLNIRDKAGTKYKIKGQYESGVPVSISNVSGNWGKTAKGWICLDYVKKV